MKMAAMALLVLIFATAILVVRSAGTVEGSFSAQVEVGGSQFSAAADFEDPGGSP